MNAPPENPVYDAVLAYQRTAALTAAVKLDIFTLIGAGTMTADALATHTGASSRGLRILCDYLTVIGLLAKQDSSYGLTPSARRFLDRSSPLAFGSCIDFLAAPEMLTLALNDPVSYVRRGGSTGLANLASDHPIWVRFANAMVPLAAPVAKRVAAYVAALPTLPRTVLDVAAGHGLYGIEVARAVPEAVVTAVDWAEVLAVAQENARGAQVDDRFRTVVGSAFDAEWGRGFDLVLLPNFLHHLGRDECVTLLRKVKASLSPTGQVLAVEFVPNADRVSPPLQAAFAFLMLVSTPSGDAYTTGDLDEIARLAGFSGATARPLPPTPQTLVVFAS
ncbi:MAG: class I SAM-dependent methyltransferase [Xanthobacteraceae bacterium]